MLMLLPLTLPVPPDSNGDGEVDVQEFVRGISVMEEACTKRETWEIKNNNSRNFVHILHRIDDVEKSMAALHQKVDLLGARWV